METSDHGLSVARELAELVAPTLGWSSKEISEQVASYERYIAAEMAAVK
jgi:glycerol-3-phosphate dehydrogenase